jgi:transposase InsO family protein
MKMLETAHAITSLCAAFAVSRSGYYRWRAQRPTRRVSEDARLKTQIKSLHAASRHLYGRPRLLAALRQRGERTSAKRVARLMRELGLRGVRKGGYRPRPSEPRQHLAYWPNRLREAPGPGQPDQVWVSDMTYVPTREGWLYVAGVLDQCSRRLLGLAMAARLDATLPQAALRQALIRRGGKHRGLIHHSDQGVQYASVLYQKTLRRHGLVPSMSRKGHCTDNAHMESFWATLKTELVAGRTIATRQQASLAIFEYVEVFYNRKRLHSALGYQTPVDFERNPTYT